MALMLPERQGAWVGQILLDQSADSLYPSDMQTRAGMRTLAPPDASGFLPKAARQLRRPRRPRLPKPHQGMAQALLLVAMILVNWPLHAQESADTLACDSMAFLDLSTIEYVPGELILAIREGNDEIVAQLRLASERETVEIGLPSWDELSADMGLRAIGAFEEYTDLTRRLFLLIFPEESDLQQVITSYCAFPYVEYVDLNEVLRNFEHVSPNEVLRISVTQQATWGMVKLEGHLRRFPK